MNKRRKQRCRDHYASDRSWDEYEFCGQYSHNETVEVWVCIECRKKREQEYEEWKEYLAEQERKRVRKNIEYNDLIALQQIEAEKQRIKQEREKRKQKSRDELHDNYVRKSLLAFVKFSGQMKISKELLQLKRATIRLNRMIESTKEKQEKLNGVLVNCKTHGALYLKDVIKGGKSRWTGEQRYKCRACMKETHRDYYERKKDYVLEKHAEYRKNNPEKRKETKAKSWRKQHGKDKKYESIEGKSTTSN